MSSSYTIMLGDHTFNHGDALCTPKRWEPIDIPDAIFDLIFNQILGVNDPSYATAELRLDQYRNQWLLDLLQRGYTAVKVSFSGDRGDLHLDVRGTKGSFHRLEWL